MPWSPSCDANDTVVEAALRSQGYRLIAAALRRPDRPQLALLKSAYPREWREIVVHLELEGGFSARLENVRSSLEAESETLLGEHDRLFEVHAGLAVPPFETEYTKLTPQHALVQGAELADIAGFYKAFGLALTSQDPERCDHIVTEIEFMHFLAFKEAYSLREGTPQHFEVVRDAERKFVVDHLSRWPESFRERLEGAEALDFYVHVARLLEAWVQRDRRYLTADSAVDPGTPSAPFSER